MAEVKVRSRYLLTDLYWQGSRPGPATQQPRAGSDWLMRCRLTPAVQNGGTAARRQPRRQARRSPFPPAPRWVTATGTCVQAWPADQTERAALLF